MKGITVFRSRRIAADSAFARHYVLETACCYVATVFAEALPVVDNGGGVLPFQLVGMPEVRSAALRYS